MLETESFTSTLAHSLNIQSRGGLSGTQGLTPLARPAPTPNQQATSVCQLMETEERAEARDVHTKG